MVMPGDKLVATITLEQNVAMEEELKFTIRENGRVIGIGVVSKIIE